MLLDRASGPACMASSALNAGCLWLHLRPVLGRTFSLCKPPDLRSDLLSSVCQTEKFSKVRNQPRPRQSPKPNWASGYIVLLEAEQFQEQILSNLGSNFIKYLTPVFFPIPGNEIQRKNKIKINNSVCVCVCV